MPVSLNYYVNITSGVGAGEVLPERQLIPLLFDDNPLIPTDGFVNFPNNGDGAANVAAYFGSSSVEFKRAAFAFGWVSKSISVVPSISFARWNSVACAPAIFGAKGVQAASSYVGITAGSFGLTIGSDTATLTGLNFSSVLSLTDVAGVIQAAINAEPLGTMWEDATVVWDSANQRFNFLGGVTGAGADNATGTFTLTGSVTDGDTITVGTQAYTFRTALSVGPIAYEILIGATDVDTTANLILAINAGPGVGTNYSTGTLANTFAMAEAGLTTLKTEFTAITAGAAGNAIATTSSITGGNGSFAAATLLGGSDAGASISVTAGSGGSDVAGQLGWLSATTILSAGSAIKSITTTLQNIAEVNNNFGSFAFVATLNTAQILEAATVNNTFNELFMYSIPSTAALNTTIQNAVGLVGGCTTTQCTTPTQYEEMIPMMIMGATQYDNPNSTQNYMFQQFAVNPSVTDTATAQALDAIGVNYYANTQQAGQVVSLYQRGQMNGLPVDAALQNTYSNEVWLKGAMSSSLMTLLLDLTKISANKLGQSQVLAICQAAIQQALNNGTISVGRALTQTEILYITNATGDSSAWKQVQNIGYWITTKITTSVVDSHTQFAINYTLIYAQDDVVNKINGTDILI